MVLSRRMSTETWAATALRHCKTTLVIGQGNMGGMDTPDGVHPRVHATGGLSGDYVGRSRSAEGTWQRGVDVAGRTVWRFVPSNQRYRNPGRGEHATCIKRAERAATFAAGNCDEHACVVYKYLTEKSPLTCLVTVVYLRSPGDHVFVVLDRSPRGDGSLNSWGPRAIVCDAWGGFVCRGRDVLFPDGTSSSSVVPKADVRALQEEIRRYDVVIRCETRPR